jgi:hypothetical protein
VPGASDPSAESNGLGENNRLVIPPAHRRRCSARVLAVEWDEEGWIEMQSLLCWLLGHDRMTTSASHRVCLRCGQKERLRNLGNVRGWVELTRTAIRGSSAP